MKKQFNKFATRPLALGMQSNKFQTGKLSAQNKYANQFDNSGQITDQEMPKKVAKNRLRSKSVAAKDMARARSKSKGGVDQSGITINSKSNSGDNQPHTISSSSRSKNKFGDSLMYTEKHSEVKKRNFVPSRPLRSNSKGRIHQQIVTNNKKQFKSPTRKQSKSKTPSPVKKRKVSNPPINMQEKINREQHQKYLTADAESRRLSSKTVANTNGPHSQEDSEPKKKDYKQNGPLSTPIHGYHMDQHYKNTNYGPMSQANMPHSGNLANLTTIMAHSAKNAAQSGFSAIQEIDILEHSPFNFYHGINPKRLLKGRSQVNKVDLHRNLSCAFCLNIIVQGKECPECEVNFCEPCYKQWGQSASAKFFNVPCKCDGDETLKGLKLLNKLKIEYLNQVRFKCNNNLCQYQLTYDELILGTHELDDCMFMKVVCEGCGTKITKYDQIRHDAVDCPNPHAKCKYCKNVHHLKELIEHERTCEQRSIVKLEYQNNEDIQMDFDRLNQELEHHNKNKLKNQLLGKRDRKGNNVLGSKTKNYNLNQNPKAVVQDAKSYKERTVNSSQNPLRQKGARDLNTELIKRDQEEYMNVDSSNQDENSRITNNLEMSEQVLPQYNPPSQGNKTKTKKSVPGTIQLQDLLDLIQTNDNKKDVKKKIADALSNKEDQEEGADETNSEGSDDIMEISHDEVQKSLQPSAKQSVKNYPKVAKVVRKVGRPPKSKAKQ